MNEALWQERLSEALAAEGLDPASRDLFIQRCEVTELAAEEAFLNKGAISRQLAYVLNGALVSSHLDSNLDPVVKGLFIRGDWVVDHHSFVKQSPSQNQIVATEPTTIVSIHLEQIHELVEISQRFLILGKIFMDAHTPFEGFDGSFSPGEKYQGLLEKRPRILAKFPLKDIASYLGMTPETLSRVRKKLAKGPAS